MEEIELELCDVSTGDTLVVGALDPDTGEIEYWHKPLHEGYEGWAGQMSDLGFELRTMTIAVMHLYLWTPTKREKKLPH